MPWLARALALLFTATIILVFGTLPGHRAALAQGRDRPTLTVGYGSLSGSYTALWVARELGLFEREGLRVEPIYIVSGSQLAQATIAGDVAIGLFSGGLLVSANLAGADLRLIGIVIDRLVFSLFGVPSVRTVADLKGGKVAVTRFGAATDVAARIALRRHHLDPEREVTILQLGGMPEILGALSTGAVQGGVLSPPSLFRARKLGLRELVDVTDLDVTFPNPGIIASQRRLQADPEQVRRFMRGFVGGIAAAKRQKEFTKAVIGRYTRTTDPEVLEETYQLFVVKLLRRLPRPDLQAVRSALDTVARQNPRARTARPEAFVDDRFIKELEQSGFVERLYP